MKANFAQKYLFEQEFETNFDPANGAQPWMQRNWTLSITLSVVYCTALYLGMRKMQHRKAFDLKNALIAWNAFLATFSIIGLSRMLPEFTSTVSRSYEASVCDNSYRMGVSGLWVALFIFSKVIEFGDTTFLVLRKRPVLFLHWYHHITVLMFCWHSYRELSSTGRWFAVMNYLVHSIMYTYYALRAAGVTHLPKFVPMFITCLQLAQMFGGLVVLLTSAYVKFLTDRPCAQSNENLFYGGVIYFSYLLLFAQFFVQTYMRRTGKYAIKTPNDLQTTVEPSQQQHVKAQ